jgi:hypothetical protein
MRRFAVAVLALAVACGGSDTTSTLPGTEGGSYALTSVNGTPLPFLESSSSGNSTYLSSGAIQLDHVAHTFTLVLHESSTGPTAQPPATTTLFGSYTMSGTSLTLTLSAANGGGTLPATWTEPTIAVTSGSRTMLFTRYGND